jgi:hypothetical protein
MRRAFPRIAAVENPIMSAKALFMCSTTPSRSAMNAQSALSWTAANRRSAVAAARPAKGFAEPPARRAARLAA